MSDFINIPTFRPKTMRRVNARTEPDDLVAEGERQPARAETRKKPAEDEPLNIESGISQRGRFLREAIRNLNLALFVVESALLILTEFLQRVRAGDKSAEALKVLHQPLGLSHLQLPIGSDTPPHHYPVSLLEDSQTREYVITLHPIDIQGVGPENTESIEDFIELYREDHRWLEDHMVELLRLGPKVDLETPEEMARETATLLANQAISPCNEQLLLDAKFLLQSKPQKH